MPSSQEKLAGIGILLALRHDIDCLGLARLLNRTRDFRLLGICRALVDLMPICHETQPDILILDAGYPANSAFEAAEQISSLECETRILFLDDALSVPHVQRAINMPWASYYSKQSSFKELSRGIHDLSQGKVTHDSAVRPLLFVDPPTQRYHLRVDGPSIANLTERELQVLKLIAEGNTVAMAAQLLGLAESTIDNHKSSVMKKLEARRIADLTRIAMREKLVD